MARPLLQIAAAVAAAGVVAWTGATVRRKLWAASRPVSQRRPIQVVAADVRRLGRQVALVPAGAPMAQHRALIAAYEDVLMEAATLLEVPNDLRTTPAGPHRDAARRQLIADLEEAGLAVRA